jgi:hypothetical protein
MTTNSEGLAVGETQNLVVPNKDGNALTNGTIATFNGKTANGIAADQAGDTSPDMTVTGTTTSQTLSTSPSSLSLDASANKDSIPTPATIPATPADSKAKTPQAVSRTEDKKDPPKKVNGWPGRYPFYRSPFQDLSQTTSAEDREEKIYWSELSFIEKQQFRKQFLRQYLSETKLCLPYVRKLFVMICRLSPWRAATILAFNIVNGLLPALTLQTRGNFIMMVYCMKNRLMVSCKLVWRRGL